MFIQQKKNDNKKYDFSFMDDDILINILIKNSGDLKNIQEKKYLNYDFFINGWGYNQGKLTYNFFDYANVYGILIKNENLRKELLDFFKNFQVNYKDYIKKLSPSGKDRIVTKTFIQKKLKEDFYKIK